MVPCAECFPQMMEAWPAQASDPLQVCLDEVDRADALVVIVAHRYGWTPDALPADEIRQSVTWLECQRAMDTGKAVLAFLIHPEQSWDDTLREEYQATALLKSGKLNEEKIKSIQENVAALAAFKDWLSSQVIVDFFKSPDDLARRVESALRMCRLQHRRVAHYARPSIGRHRPAETATRRCRAR